MRPPEDLRRFTRPQLRLLQAARLRPLPRTIPALCQAAAVAPSSYHREGVAPFAPRAKWRERRGTE